MSFERIAIPDGCDAKITVSVSRETMIGLHSLITWIDGFKRAKSGDIPGDFELVMFYRQLVHELGPKLPPLDPRYSSSAPKTQET